MEAVEDEVEAEEAEVDIGEASEVKPAGDDAMEGQQFWHNDCCAEEKELNIVPRSEIKVTQQEVGQLWSLTQF